MNQINTTDLSEFITTETQEFAIAFTTGHHITLTVRLSAQTLLAQFDIANDYYKVKNYENQLLQIGLQSIKIFEEIEEIEKKYKKNILKYKHFLTKDIISVLVERGFSKDNSFTFEPIKNTRKI
jgi:hypothetical protein